MIRARSTNKLLQSPHYQVILKEYNDAFRNTGGRVNSKKFWEENIRRYLPNYPLATWYGFLSRFKSDSQGIVLAIPQTQDLRGAPPGEIELHQNLMKDQEATVIGISHALNLGAQVYKNIYDKYMKDPDSLTDFEKSILKDSLHKAMKSQDSRIHALGKVREDGREQAKFERAFSNAAFESDTPSS